MKILSFLLGTTFLGGVFFASDIRIKKPETDITFCQLSVSDDDKNAHMSFTVGYSFRLDENGKPREIKKILGSQLNDEQAFACISRWQFPKGASDSLMTAYFRWEHAVGWTELKVSGKDFSQKVKIEGERCPYSGANKTSK
jgi:hypothetical protein